MSNTTSVTSQSLDRIGLLLVVMPLIMDAISLHVSLFNSCESGLTVLWCLFWRSRLPSVTLSNQLVALLSLELGRLNQHGKLVPVRTFDIQICARNKILENALARHL